MAVKDCDKVSNIIAVAIAAGDDDISNVVASLSKIKNDALQRSRALRESGEAVDTVTGYTPHELELRASSADIKIRAIVQASILKGDKGNEAFTELARQIKKTKGSIAGGVNLLEMVHNAPMADYQEIARLRDNTMDVSDAIKDLNDGLSEFISSNYSIRAYSDFYEGEVANAKKALKDKKIDEKEYEKRIEGAHKEAMNKIAKGENPSGFVPLDNEWQAIKKVYGDDPKMAGRAWSQYIMAREFLADGGLDEDLLKAFEFGGEELLGDLTPEWIAKCVDLDQLLARAFTNAEQLYRDGTLRAVYRDKLSELASGGVLTEKNAKKMRTLVNVSLFAEEGATLSDVLLDNRAYTSMKDMGFKVTERQGGQIYNDLRSFARVYNDSIEKGEVDFWDMATKIAGQEVQPKDILQLIYDITGDKNILALVEAGNFSDGAILNMATQKLLGDNEKAKTALIKLFKKGKEGNKITNSRGVFLRAITGLEVPDGANIAFFDYRRGLYYKDELSSAKADFMDKLAEKNKMKVVSDGIQDLTMLADATDENVQLLVQQLKDKNIAGGFIIVNDSAYKDNPLLRKALDQFTDDKSITVLYPRGGLGANFSMEDGSIFYKTIYDDTYDNVAGRISIQSMGEAKPTPEMLASAYESQTGRNGKMVEINSAMKRGTEDDFFEKGDGYVNIKKPVDELWEEDGCATLYDVINNKWYDGEFSILGEKLKTDKESMKESYKKYKKIKIKDGKIPVITMYRVSPDGAERFIYGDYITPSKEYANSINQSIYGGTAGLIKERVPINKIRVRKDKSIEEGCYFYTKNEIDDAAAAFGEPISAAAAMVRYNDELNKAAVKYFGQVLGESSEVVDSEYIRRVETLLSDMLGMDIKTFDTFKDNSELWRRIDKELTLERLTTGRFDKEIVDIKKVRDDIANMSDEELAKDINEKFGVLVRGGTIEGNENISLIREAWFDYNTAKDTTDLLSAKGKIISLVNGVNAQTVSIDDIKTMFQNKTFADKYKELFFPEQALNDKDMELFIRQINSDLFDGLSIQFAENLVKAGYSLPLVNVKRVVYDYLNNSLDLNSDFVQAFFYKNNIPYTKDNLDTIMTTLMPKEFSFDFDVLKGRLYDDSLVGNVSTVVESPNRFLPDSYSALYAIEDSGNGITLGNKEYDVLVGMVDKYIDTVLKGMSEGKLKFGDAQTLKAELSYAMDTFEQDFIMPKYGTFLTPQDRQTILGMKYTIPIGVTGQPINEVEKMLNAWRIRLLGDGKTTKGEFRRILGTMVDNADINAAIAKGYNKAVTPKELQERIERRRNQLITNGSTIKEINGEYVVYDSKDALWETINSLPDNIEGLAGLKAMGRDEIENMTNKQAYILLRYLEAAKSLSATADYATQLMYKQSPQLAQYSFFSTYVVDPETGLPRIMKNNSLNVDEFFNNIAGSVTADDAIKKDIFTDIVNKFRKDGYVLAHSKKDADGKILERGLDDIISSAVNRQVDELQSIKLTPENIVEAKNKMQNIYTNMFIPYTYLKDIPDGGYVRMLGSAQNVVPLEDVKKKVETTMKEAYTKAIEDLKAAGATDADKIQQVITIRLNDGERLTLADLANQNIDSWKKQIFNDQSIFVRGADEDGEFVVDETETLAKQQEIKKEEKEYRERIQNSYLGSLQTILNEGQSVSDAERELMTSFMLDVRTDLRKYDLTSKLVDALDALSGINEEVARGIKNYLIGFGGTITFGKYKPGDILERYKLVRDAYKGYYDMSLEQLMKAAPKNHAEEVAWNAARYFKNLERLLGSVDGVQGVTTSKEANKAFYHLGEVFMNLNTNPQSTEGVRGIFSMLSAIEQNQPLKFFKFSEAGQASYYKPFKQNPAGKDRGLDGLGGYRDYVETINNITREDFNKLFGANYSDEQFKRVLQGLSGFSLTGGGLWRKINKIMDIMNGSWLAFRFAMSYPGQLITIPLQGVAYFLKQLGHELRLGIEDLSSVDDIREQFGILDGAYNELNVFGKLNFNPDSKDVNSFYNRYGIPDIKEFYKDTGITAADDYVNMYAKLDAKYSKPDKIMNAIRWFDPYKDNANNFVDGVFARNFKNIAFVKGLKDNDFMKFSTAEDFLDFMNDATINAEVKSKLLDSVAASAGRNFRNILGLGFGGIDRAIGAKQWQNILFGLMQMLNFRGSWGQNIVKQTGANITHLLQWMVGGTRLSKTSRDEVVKFIANSPEYVNFMTALMTDLEWAYKLARYQDNGRWPDEDKDGIYYFLDYLSFMGENMNMVSQWRQGLQSYGPLRLLQEQWQSALRSQMDPTVYQDTYGLGALFNAIGKNFLRQWKPINWLTELVGAFEFGGPKNARAFITNRFFNLSFGSLRYMVNEDENAYGYTYEVTGQYGGIPSIVMGEAQMGSDKSFTYELDNNETWKNLELFFFEDIPWSQKKVYGGNLWSALVNGSQFASALKNSIKVVTGKYSKSFFTSEDLAGPLKKTVAGRELYEKGYITPRTNAEASTFMKTILNNSEYRPGSSSFNKSLINFEDFGHMAGEKGKEADSGMELWLEHMKYQTDGHGEFIKENGQRVIDPGRTALITNVKTYYGNTDYVTNVIYNYAKDWLDIHNSDPNYSMYMKMLGQGRAHMLLEKEVKKRVKEKNIGLSKDWKWNQTKFDQAEYRDMLLEIGNTVLEGDNMTFFDKLNRLDIDDATLAAIRIIEKQSTEEDRKEIEKFFVLKTDEKDDDIVEELELKPQYQGVLKQIANIGRAMDEGNVERVIATASSLTNLYKEDDPTGITTASIVNSIFNRIYKAPNLTPEQKQEMMIGVFYDNKDFIQRNPEKMRELLGDNYDAYADLMNEMIYKRDGQVISNLESLQSSGTGSKSSTAKGRKLSNNLKSIALSNGSRGGGTTKTGKRAGQGYGERVPVVIKGADLVKQLGLKGYSPLNVKKTVFEYTPHADFSLRKDINRNVKGPKTETISKKKQLSNLETNVEKAIEAES